MKKLTKKQLDATNYRTCDADTRLIKALQDAKARVDALTKDPDKTKRIAARQCLTCHYITGYRIVGRMFTAWHCRICMEPQPLRPDTGVPLTCHQCSLVHNLCVSCGASMDLLLRPLPAKKK